MPFDEVWPHVVIQDLVQGCSQDLFEGQRTRLHFAVCQRVPRTGAPSHSSAPTFGVFLCFRSCLSFLCCSVFDGQKLSAKSSSKRIIQESDVCFMKQLP